MANPPANSQTRIAANTGNTAQVFIEDMPPIPQEVKDRFPSMGAWELAMKEWVKKLNFVVNPQ